MINVNLYIGLKFLDNIGNISVTTATNGGYILKEFDNRSFDIILFALNMPNVDGYQFTRIIREKYTGV